MVALNKAARKYRRTREQLVAIAIEDWLDGSKYQRIRQEIARSVDGGSQR